MSNPICIIVLSNIVSFYVVFIFCRPKFEKIMEWKLAFPSATASLLFYTICIIHNVSVWFYFSLCMKNLCPLNEAMRLLRINEALRISLFRNNKLGHCSSHTTMNETFYWLLWKSFETFFRKLFEILQNILSQLNVQSHCLTTYCRLVWILR